MVEYPAVICSSEKEVLISLSFSSVPTWHDGFWTLEDNTGEQNSLCESYMLVSEHWPCAGYCWLHWNEITYLGWCWPASKGEKGHELSHCPPLWTFQNNIILVYVITCTCFALFLLQYVWEASYYSRFYVFIVSQLRKVMSHHQEQQRRFERPELFQDGVKYVWECVCERKGK